MRLNDFSEDKTEISKEILNRLGVKIPANKNKFNISD